LYEIAFSTAYQRIKTKRPNLVKIRNGSCDEEEDDDDEQHKSKNSEIIMWWRWDLSSQDGDEKDESNIRIDVIKKNMMMRKNMRPK